jgi:hypothetical protein
MGRNYRRDRVDSQGPFDLLGKLTEWFRRAYTEVLLLSAAPAR